MRSFPPVPALADAPGALLSGGHLWIQELVDAGPLRFRLRSEGWIQFGDADRTFDGDPPAPYRTAVRHVRERLDRDALRSAVEDPAEVVCFGGSVHCRTVPYDFARTPPFLGFDVWDGSRERYLPPDAVERVFERLGLRPVNAVRKEVRAVDFDPETYAFPDSAWYDGPVPGVVLRDKTGNRATLSNPAFDGGPPDPVEGDAADVADRLVSDDLIRRARESLADADDGERAEPPPASGGGATGDPATVPAVVDRTVELLLREEWGRIAAGDGDPDPGAIRGAVAERVRRFVDGT